MLNIITVGRRALRRRAEPAPGETNYLLTAAGNRICTAAENRIRLGPYGNLLTAAGNVLCTASGRKISLIIGE